eukprot:TRINITY_DN24495_c0_g1_i2.p1 TRINITY_DN24495_c0_g1~~TRINITY_DN24495_c0_g1_i2.p1  ORF type:complete len:149 (+),score=23.43 TRINITY_DN24495_c0_g1_i2:99-545(+)
MCIRDSSHISGTTTVEVWQTIAISSSYSSWMHIKGIDSETLELSVAGQGLNLGVGCGVRLFAGPNYTRSDGDFSDPAPANPGCGSVMDPVCVDSIALGNSSGSCSSLVYTIDGFTNTDLDSGAYQTIAQSISEGTGLPSTLTDFNEQA